MTTGSRIGSDAPVGGLGYRPSLDGIRALAIVLVVAFHIDRGGRLPLLPGGFLGVDVFFVLSGFLITSLLIDERSRHGGVHLGAFWARRAARLFPILWSLLAVMAFAKWVHPIQGLTPPTTGGFLAILLYVANWLPATGRTGLNELQYVWSLSVEEQFYVVWPLVAVGLLATAARRVARGAATIAVVSAAGALAVIVLRATTFEDARWFFNTFLRCDGLLLGAALAGSRRWWEPVAARLWAPLVVLGLAGCWMAVDGAWVGRESVPTWRLPLLEVAVLAITAAVVAAPRSPAARAAGLAPLVWLGRRSYALYLLHLPIFDIFQAHLGLDRPRLRAVVEVPVALAAAGLAHRVIEIPGQRRMRRLLRAERTVAAPRSPAPAP